MANNGLIDPVYFDVIILGTGLQEALLAAAAAACRLTVLHLDPHDFYGAHWTSLGLKQFSSWAAAGGCFTSSSSSRTDLDSNSSLSAPICDGNKLNIDSSTAAKASVESSSNESATGAIGDSDDDISHRLVGTVQNDSQELGDLGQSHRAASLEELGLGAIELEGGRYIYSGVEVCEYEGVSLGETSSYNIDLSGPRVTFCGSNLINLLLRSGANHHVAFKGIDASYIWTGSGILAVPSSRADVFKDSSLTLPDKRHLMRFFKLVTDYATLTDQSILDISAEDLDGPFANFLQRQRLPPSIQSIIFYAIALVDDEQRLDVKDHGALLSTRHGLQKLALYLSSVARFPNAPGAFIYPLYGQGELPQAFCRSAAVNGTIYVLRRPVNALLVDKDSKEYKGIRTSQGQLIYSKNLIMGPSVVPKSGNDADSSKLGSPNEQYKETAWNVSSAEGRWSGYQVVRCVCITDRSISAGLSTLLVFFPPRSIQQGITSVIRALQLSSEVSVCPPGKYIVHLSTICNDSVNGREVLKAAVDVLFSGPDTINSETNDEDSRLDVSTKPMVLWSVFYMQSLHTSAEKLTIPGVTICTMPDGSLDGESFLADTEKLFRDLFPDKDYFPQASEPDNLDIEEDE